MAAFAGPTILGVETGNFGRGKAIIIPEVVPAIRRFAFYAFYMTESGPKLTESGLKLIRNGVKLARSGPKSTVNSLK